jgi:hypothetical protein
MQARHMKFYVVPHYADLSVDPDDEGCLAIFDQESELERIGSFPPL